MIPDLPKHGLQKPEETDWSSFFSPTIVTFNLLGPVLATEEEFLFFLSAKDI